MSIAGELAKFVIASTVASVAMGADIVSSRIIFFYGVNPASLGQPGS